MGDKAVEHDISEEICQGKIELTEKEKEEAAIKEVWVLSILRKPSQFYIGPSSYYGPKHTSI